MATVSGSAEYNAASGDNDVLVVTEQSAIDKLVAALVRIRGVDRLDRAIITRCCLAADLRMSAEDLDGLLKLLRWRGLINLPNEHLVTVLDATALKAIAAGQPEIVGDARPPTTNNPNAPSVKLNLPVSREAVF